MFMIKFFRYNLFFLKVMQEIKCTNSHDGNEYYTFLISSYLNNSFDFNEPSYAMKNEEQKEYEEDMDKKQTTEPSNNPLKNEKIDNSYNSSANNTEDANKKINENSKNDENNKADESIFIHDRYIDNLYNSEAVWDEIDRDIGMTEHFSHGKNIDIPDIEIDDDKTLVNNEKLIEEDCLKYGIVPKKINETDKTDKKPITESTEKKYEKKMIKRSQTNKRESNDIRHDINPSLPIKQRKLNKKYTTDEYLTYNNKFKNPHLQKQGDNSSTTQLQHQQKIFPEYEELEVAEKNLLEISTILSDFHKKIETNIKNHSDIYEIINLIEEEVSYHFFNEYIKKLNDHVNVHLNKEEKSYSTNETNPKHFLIYEEDGITINSKYKTESELNVLYDGIKNILNENYLFYNHKNKWNANNHSFILANLMINTFSTDKKTYEINKKIFKIFQTLELVNLSTKQLKQNIEMKKRKFLIIKCSKKLHENEIVMKNFKAEELLKMIKDNYLDGKSYRNSFYIQKIKELMSEFDIHIIKYNKISFDINKKKALITNMAKILKKNKKDILNLNIKIRNNIVNQCKKLYFISFFHQVGIIKDQVKKFIELINLILKHMEEYESKNEFKELIDQLNVQIGYKISIISLFYAEIISFLVQYEENLTNYA